MESNIEVKEDVEIHSDSYEDDGNISAERHMKSDKNEDDGNIGAEK